MCDEGNIQIDEKCVKKTTVVMNHSITNQIDAFHFLVMYILVFVLYFYQCTKINNYAKGSNKYIQFQVLFYLLTLFRIMQLSYSYLGYELDQQANEWFINKKNLIYCDTSFEYDKKGYCYQRYEIDGILQNSYLYLGTIALQMISFFWYLQFQFYQSHRQKQISPLMFLTIYKVLMNQFIPLQTKIIYLFFIIIDIVMLVCQIVVWLLMYEEQSYQIIHYFQLIFASLTTLSLLQIIYKQYKSGVHLYSNNSSFVYLALFILARTIFIAMRSFTFDNDYVNAELKKSINQSIIYMVFNTIEFLSRIIMIQLF